MQSTKRTRVFRGNLQLDRVVQYSTSNIALQRLVHTKMIAETARLVGYDDTGEFIILVLAPTMFTGEMDQSGGNLKA